MTAPTAKLFPRFAADRVTTALKDTPVVMVNGPRQCGKTTMVREFASRNRTYITLDDDTVLQSVRNDPSGSCAAWIWPLWMRFNELQNFCAPSRSPSTLTAVRDVSY